MYDHVVWPYDCRRIPKFICKFVALISQILLLNYEPHCSARFVFVFVFFQYQCP